MSTRPFPVPILAHSEIANGLKPATRSQLVAHAARRRAWSHDDLRVVLTPYVPQAHGTDVLLFLWLDAAQGGEQRHVFGHFAASPSAFVHTYLQTAEIILLHAEGTDWQHGEGLLAMAWIDDVIEGARARLHHYLRRDYRHPRLSSRLAAMVLTYLFEARGFQLLYGLTPADNPLAIRLAQRHGFERQGVWKNAMLSGGLPVDAVHTSLSREQWENRVGHTTTGPGVRQETSSPAPHKGVEKAMGGSSQAPLPITGFQGQGPPLSVPRSQPMLPMSMGAGAGPGQAAGSPGAGWGAGSEAALIQQLMPYFSALMGQNQPQSLPGASPQAGAGRK